ncbi:MAG: NCS2 family permease [Treponema sp.]|jgi:AGZA family xanthine/uracil permease-like MFS transporter|nr:NCS2 family permease [Treponema sp.]
MEKIFQLQRYGTTAQREIMAGLTTFLTMAYILALNPAMLGAIGNGMTPGAVFTATAVASAIATLLMAFLAKLPVALAPSIVLNAFFTNTVVKSMGYSWQQALTAVFLEGILFIIISAFVSREAIVNGIPVNLKKAVAAGIGLFIALTGFSSSGMILRGVGGNIVGLGNMADPGTFLAVVGLIFIIILYSLNVPGAILIGILGTTILSIPMGITDIPQNWKPFSVPQAPLLFKFDFSNIVSFKFFTVFFLFFFVDIFDTVGTLVGVTARAGLVEKDGSIPRLKQAFLADAIGTVAGAALGTSTVTSRVESAAGVAAGGRTGLTALSTGIFFLLALLFWPVFRLIPGAAIAPALIFTGFIMMASVVEINFKDPTEGIPAFMVLVMTPFAYSIVEGIVYGVLAYVILKVVTRRFNEIKAITWVLFSVFILRFFIK